MTLKRRALDFAWQGISIREREVLELRSAGFTLEQIGLHLGVTRERTRQVERDGSAALIQLVETRTDFADFLETCLARSWLITADSLSEALGGSQLAPIQALLKAHGLRNPRVFDIAYTSWWCRDQARVEAATLSVIVEAPFEEEKLLAHTERAEFPLGFDLRAGLRSPRSPLVELESGFWVRRASKSADAAYLWLREQLTPDSAENIARATGAVSVRALGEVMRRNSDRFVQLRPEGTWALTEWQHFGLSIDYRDATEVVIAVLRDMGPLPERQLVDETQRRYPVSKARVMQCFASSSVGLNEDGLFDLSERGAVPITPVQPRKPDWVAESGSRIAVKYIVNYDLLRGSGLGLSPWVTWRLGIHNYPASRTFSGDFPVVVRRQSSGSAISTLREAALALRLREGCAIAVIMETTESTCTVRHSCTNPCPNDM